jgi:hypothetical protein
MPCKQQRDASNVPLPPPDASIHRICIQRNDAFCISADQFDAQHYPKCHNG